MLFNKDLFISEVTNWLKKKGIKFVGQQGLLEVLTFIESDDDWTDERQVANFLAQTGHETGFKWKAIPEIRARVGTDGRRKQDKYWGTGYYGRGLIQLTHKDNYAKLAKRLNIPELVTKPDLALEPKTSYEIAAVGMREGLFSGKKLSTYIDSTAVPLKCDYYNARRIVNILDRASDIQAYSIFFEKIIFKCLVDDKEIPVNTEVDHENINDTKNNLVGSKPEDPSIQIPHVEESKMSGLKSWWTTVSTTIGTLGISGSSLWSVLSGYVTNEKYIPILLNIGMICLIFTGIIIITYLILRAIGKAREVKMAHDLTIKQMEIRANPSLYNVEVTKNEDNK